MAIALALEEDEYDKHIRIINPVKCSSDYFNHKHFFSVVLMALVDSNYCFLLIDVGTYSREGHPNVFKKSLLGKKLYDYQLNILLSKMLPNDDGVTEQPFVIVGDDAFALHDNLLRPYPRKNLDFRKRVFNLRLTQVTRYVECTFGILASGEFFIRQYWLNLILQLCSSSRWSRI